MMIADKPFPAATTRTAMRIIRMRELLERIPLSASYMYALIQLGRFPKPFPLITGGRAVGWLENDVLKWMENRASDAQKTVK